MGELACLGAMATERDAGRIAVEVPGRTVGETEMNLLLVNPYPGQAGGVIADRITRGLKEQGVTVAQARIPFELLNQQPHIETFCEMLEWMIGRVKPDLVLSMQWSVRALFQKAGRTFPALPVYVYVLDANPVENWLTHPLDRVVAYSEEFASYRRKVHPTGPILTLWPPADPDPIVGVWSKYRSDVSFVGGVNTYSREYRNEVLERWDRVQHGVRGYVNEMIDLCVAGMVTCNFYDLFENYPPPFGDFAVNDEIEPGITPIEKKWNVWGLIRSAASAEYRLRILEAASVFDLKVWGGNFAELGASERLQSKCTLESVPRFYAGDVYVSAKINLNCQGFAFKHAPTMRFMDIPAASGFEICEKSTGLVEAFPSDVAMAYYRSPEDLVKRIRYWLSRDKERRDLITVGRRLVVTEHSYRQWVRKFMAYVEQTK
jgi:hypothetical protein